MSLVGVKDNPQSPYFTRPLRAKNHQITTFELTIFVIFIRIPYNRSNIHCQYRSINYLTIMFHMFRFYAKQHTQKVSCQKIILIDQSQPFFTTFSHNRVISSCVSFFAHFFVFFADSVEGWIIEGLCFDQ